MNREAIDLVTRENPCGILVLDSRGDLYRNQTGGYACYQREARGTILNCKKYVQVVDDLLMNYFMGEKYGGWCCDGIDEEAAHVINAVLDLGFNTEFQHDKRRVWRVDQSKLKDSLEAWVYVVKGDSKGVLFWSNSD